MLCRTTEKVKKATTFIDYYFHTEWYRPNIIMRDKGKNNCHISDTAIQNDTNVGNKMTEKFTNYSDLNVEMARLFGKQEGEYQSESNGVWRFQIKLH